MTTLSPDLTLVLNECRLWNVPVLLFDKPDVRPVSAYPNSDHDAPQHDVEILWPGGIICVRDPDLNRPALAHELVHVVVGTNPESTSETGPMLWLESEMARRLGYFKQWQEWMEPYNLIDESKSTGIVWSSDAIEWGEAPLFVRRRFLRRARKKARAEGLINGRGKPTYRRAAAFKKWEPPP